MVLNSTDQNELWNIVNTLKNTCSNGSGGISSFIIKATVNEIVNPLTLIFNISLSTSVVPNILKIAKVVPIHISYDKGLVNNYRPISVIPFISRILER